MIPGYSAWEKPTTENNLSDVKTRCCVMASGFQWITAQVSRETDSKTGVVWGGEGVGGGTKCYSKIEKAKSYREMQILLKTCREDQGIKKGGNPFPLRRGNRSPY